MVLTDAGSGIRREPQRPVTWSAVCGSLTRLVGFLLKGRGEKLPPAMGAEFARELASQAAQFAAEVKRLHAQQAQDSGTGSAGDGEAA